MKIIDEREINKIIKKKKKKYRKEQRKQKPKWNGES